MELHWGPGDHLRMKPARWLRLYLGDVAEQTVAPHASIASGATDERTVAQGRDERDRERGFPRWMPATWGR